MISNALFMEVKDGKIFFSGRQAQIAICTSMSDITFDQPFSCLFDVDLFLPAMAKFKQGEITLEYQEDSNQLIIRGKKASLKITCMDVNDWTPLKRVENPTLVISTDTLFPYISQCKHALPTDQQDSVMSSFHVEYENSKWKIMALDGKRISSRGSLDKAECSVLFNGLTMTTLESIFQNKEITLKIQDEDIEIEDNQTRVLLRSVSGNYFNVDRILAAPSKYKVKVNREELLDAVDLANVVVHSIEKKKIRLSFHGDDNQLIVAAEDVMGNHITTEVDASYSEPFSMEMGMSPKFLAEALKSLPDDTLVLEIISDISPMVIRGCEFLEVVLPIKIR